jgi:NADH-quinone oxidoreductase subunit I
VLAVSTVSPKVRTIAVVRPGPDDVTYLEATRKGLGVTLRHFMKNILGKRRPADVLAKGTTVADKGFLPWNEIETIQYPEEKTHYPERFRGLHRLMQREDGNIRCVACMCCPTVCPANCITIVPAEVDDKGVEKAPAVFEIDELRCVVCGLCVEACPCDAIRMDTGEHARPVEDRANAIETKESMLARGLRSTAVQGGEGPEWRSGEASAPDEHH